MRFSCIAGIAFAGLCTLCASTAMAKDKVAVMKLDSLGSDTDELAAMVLDSVRVEVMKSQISLDSNGSDITYAEMQMVTGCDKDESIACYDAACETLGASAIIFGSVNDGGETKLVWYVSGKGIIREVSGVVTDKESANELARDVVVGEVGYLIVTTNVPGADVFVDGKRVGVSTSPKDEPAPIELVANNYIVAVRMEGYNREDAVKVSVVPKEKATVHFDMTVATDPEVFRMAFKTTGWVSLGVGVASLAVGAGLGGASIGWHDDMIKNMAPKYNAIKADDLNKKGKSGTMAANILFGVGGFFTATGVALLCVGYLYDFTGEKADSENMLTGYMPDIDFQLNQEYQGVTMGWTF